MFSQPVLNIGAEWENEWEKSDNLWSSHASDS